MFEMKTVVLPPMILGRSILRIFPEWWKNEKSHFEEPLRETARLHSAQNRARPVVFENPPSADCRANHLGDPRRACGRRWRAPVQPPAGGSARHLAQHGVDGLRSARI